MAFHPYPRVIPSVFNLSGFGPPRGLTPASACPWVAHPASRLRRATERPVQTRSRCGSVSSLNLAAHRNSLAHSTKGTPSHPQGGAPTACGRTVSGTVSLPSRGAFHLSLTVLVRYRSQESIQAWRVVPPASDRVSRARPYSGTSAGVHPRVRLRGCDPVPPALPCRSAPLDGSPPGAPAPGREALQPRRRYRLAPARSPVWPSVPFRSPLLGESRS